MDNRLEVLIQVRELFSDLKRWTQDSAARDKAGNPIDVLDVDAYSFCLLGACRRFSEQYNTNSESLFRSVHRLLVSTLPKIDRNLLIITFNDKRTHKSTSTI